MFFEGCPNQCSGKGRCVNDICECLAGWSTEDCSKSVNDNHHAPAFRYSAYYRTVSADAKSRMAIVDVLATDRDQGKNGEIRYVLEPYATETDTTSYLVVDSVSGRVSLLSPASSILVVTYTLLVWVKAVDGGLPPRDAKVPLRIRIRNY